MCKSWSSNMAAWRNGIASDYDCRIIRRLQVRALRWSLFRFFFFLLNLFSRNPNRRAFSNHVYILSTLPATRTLATSVPQCLRLLESRQGNPRVHQLTFIQHADDIEAPLCDRANHTQNMFRCTQQCQDYLHHLIYISTRSCQMLTQKEIQALIPDPAAMLQAINFLLATVYLHLK
jgi:hypothetical protein